MVVKTVGKEVYLSGIRLLREWKRWVSNVFSVLDCGRLLYLDSWCFLRIVGSLLVFMYWLKFHDGGVVGKSKFQYIVRECVSVWVFVRIHTHMIEIDFVASDDSWEVGKLGSWENCCFSLWGLEKHKNTKTQKHKKKQRGRSVCGCEKSVVVKIENWKKQSSVGISQNRNTLPNVRLEV